MRRVLNDPDEMVEDALKGLLPAHPDLVAATENACVLRRAGPLPDGWVGVVTGGGSEHEPVFLGYIGPGLLDAVVIGEVFASPAAKGFHGAFRAADDGCGVAWLYGNYAGDNTNVKMAVKPSAKDGTEVRTVVANDATRSIGIGLSACTIPAAGKPNFVIEDGTMEVGIGHHGEPALP